MRILRSIVMVMCLPAAPVFAESATDQWGGAAAEWSHALARSEARLPAATAGQPLGAVEREAVLAQVHSGAASMRTLALASIAPDTVLAGSLLIPIPPYPRQGQWGNRFIRATGIFAFSCGMVNLALGMQEQPDNELRQTLGNVAGIVGGAGGLYSIVRPRPRPPPYVDQNERTRIMVREMILRETFAESGRLLGELASEFATIAADPAPTDSATIVLLQRYSGAVDRASSLFDVQVPHLRSAAAGGAADNSCNAVARARLGQFAAQLDAVALQWRTWRWVAGGSQRDALAYLAVLGR